MSNSLEIFIEMFPNIAPKYVKEIFRDYMKEEKILDKLLYLTSKQNEVFEPKDCDICVLKDEKYNRFLGGIKNFFSIKNKKYERFLSKRID